MSSMNLFGALETQKNLYGNSYANIEFDRKGRVKALWPIDSSKVTVYIDDVGLLNSKSKMWYVVNVNGKQIKLMPDEMLHFKNGLTLDGLVGVPTMDYLKSTVENSASAQKFINNFYKQGLQVKGLVQYVGDLNEDAKKSFFVKISSPCLADWKIAIELR